MMALAARSSSLSIDSRARGPRRHRHYLFIEFFLAEIRFGAKMVRSGVRGEREGRADPAPSVSMSAVGQQRDPLAPPAGRRRRLPRRW
jgi:hypothetical protein